MLLSADCQLEGASSTDGGGEGLDGASSNLEVETRSPDEPILITSDTELVSMASAEGWSGNGTEGDPYVITGYSIDGASHRYCIKITDVTLHISIFNNVLQNVPDERPQYYNSALHLEDVSNASVERNTVRNASTYGIYALRSSLTVGNNTITQCSIGAYIAVCQVLVVGNTVADFSEYGVRLLGCHGADVWVNTIAAIPTASHRDGIHIMGATACRVRFNDIKRGNIWTYLVHRSRINNNTVNGTFYVQDSDGTEMTHNTIRAPVIAMTLNKCTNAHLRRTYLHEGMLALRGEEPVHFNSHSIDRTNTVEGYPIGYFVGASGSLPDEDSGQLILVECDDITITRSNVAEACYGVEFAYTDGAVLSGIDGEDRWHNAIRAFCSDHIEISSCTFSNISIVLESTNHTVLRGNCLIETWVTDDFGSCNAFIGNEISVTLRFAIDLHNTLHARVLDNTITVLNELGEARDSEYGLNTYDCQGGEVKNNTFEGNGAKVYAAEDSRGWYNVDWDDRNTLNGLPLLYIRNATGLTVDDPVSQLYLVRCRDCVVERQDIAGGAAPMTFVECRNVTIQYNRLENCSDQALFIFDCDEMLVTRNIIRGGGTSIFMRWGRSCTLEGNYLMDTTFSGLTMLGCWRCTFTRNYLTGCCQRGGSALVVGDSIECSVTYNHFEDNTLYALSSSEGTSNSFYHNYFVDNNASEVPGRVSSPQCWGRGASDSWDDGSEGNHWSEYTDRYPSASNDGTVWDTPYVIDARTANADRYPLVAFQDVIPPIALTDMRDMEVHVGSSFEFKVLWSIDNVGITRTAWEIEREGEPLLVEGNVLNHTFDLPGVYNVTFRVEDGAGNLCEETSTIRAVDEEPPVAHAGADITIDVGGAAHLNATNSTDNAGIGSYSWEFEYGGATVTRRGATVTFWFDAPGVYMVTLTVTDRAGNTATDTLTVTVLDVRVPVADAGPDIVVDQLEVVLLDARGSYDDVGIVWWEWTVRAGLQILIYANETVTLAFEDAGVYNVTLRVEDAAGNWAEDALRITVRDITPPVADAGEDFEVPQFEHAQFNGSLSSDDVGVYSLSWQFVYRGRTRTMVGTYPSFIFQDVGTWTVELYVEDEAGNLAYDEVTVTVVDAEPPQVAMALPMTTEQGQTVQLDGSVSTDNVCIVNWSWRLSHGEEVRGLHGPRPSFRIPLAGLWNVTLTARDARGNSNSTEETFWAVDTEPPVAIVAGDLEVDVGESVTLDGSLSTDNLEVAEWRWTIIWKGLEDTVEGERPTYVFERGGSYLVHLTISDAVGLQNSTSFYVMAKGRGGGDDDGGTGFGVVAAIIAAVVIALVLALMMLRRRAEEP